MNEEIVVTGCDSGKIVMWHRANGTVLRRFKADHRIVNCTLAHPTKPILASSGIDSDIKVWTLASNKKILDSILAFTGTDDDEGEAMDTSASKEKPAAGTTTAGSSTFRHVNNSQGSLGRSGLADDDEIGIEMDDGEDNDDDGDIPIPPRLLLALLAAYRREME